MKAARRIVMMGVVADKPVTMYIGFDSRSQSHRMFDKKPQTKAANAIRNNV
jgi:hypothetical protein